MKRGNFDFSLLLLVSACSSGDGGDGRGFRGGQSGVVAQCSIPAYTCPDSGVPSYEKDVVPVLTARCLGCHGNGGVGKDLTTLLNVKKSSAQSQIRSCLMPPPPLAPLTPEEEATVLTWLGCGAPPD